MSPNLREAINSLLESADDSGCSEDLTVVAKSAVENLRGALDQAEREEALEAQDKEFE